MDHVKSNFHLFKRFHSPNLCVDFLRVIWGKVAWWLHYRSPGITAALLLPTSTRGFELHRSHQVNATARSKQKILNYKEICFIIKKAIKHQIKVLVYGNSILLRMGSQNFNKVQIAFNYLNDLIHNENVLLAKTLHCWIDTAACEP